MVLLAAFPAAWRATQSDVPPTMILAVHQHHVKRSSV
jgi:hypothetical protein